MAIYEILKGKSKDSFFRTNSSFFNGSLAEYLNGGNTEYETLFREFLETEPELQICINLPIDISTKAISNQIIRYKDAFKLPSQTIVKSLGFNVIVG